ncbi:hypothetical protein EMCRGX_G010301 [Ephydatia muelleri]
MLLLSPICLANMTVIGLMAAPKIHLKSVRSMQRNTPGLLDRRIGPKDMFIVLLYIYEETGYIQRKPGSGRPSQVTAEVKVIDEAKMQEDDETSAVQLNCLLNGKGFPISLRTILRCRSTLGWIFRGSAYCQLIRDANKIKNVQLCVKHLHDSFNDVVNTD